MMLLLRNITNLLLDFLAKQTGQDIASKAVDVGAAPSDLAQEFRRTRVFTDDSDSAWSIGFEYLGVRTSRPDDEEGRCPRTHKNPDPARGGFSTAECKEALDSIIDHCKVRPNSVPCVLLTFCQVMKRVVREIRHEEALSL